MKPSRSFLGVVVFVILASGTACESSRVTLAEVAPVPDEVYRSEVVDLAEQASLESRIVAAAERVLRSADAPRWRERQTTEFKARHAQALASIVGSAGITRPDLRDPASTTRRAFTLPGDEPRPSPAFRGFDTRFTVDHPLAQSDLVILIDQDLAFAFYFDDPHAVDGTHTRPADPALDLPPIRTTAGWLILFPSSLLLDRTNP